MTRLARCEPGCSRLGKGNKKPSVCALGVTKVELVESWSGRQAKLLWKLLPPLDVGSHLGGEFVLHGRCPAAYRAGTIDVEQHGERQQDANRSSFDLLHGGSEIATDRDVANPKIERTLLIDAGSSVTVREHPEVASVEVDVVEHEIQFSGLESFGEWFLGQVLGLLFRERSGQNKTPPHQCTSGFPKVAMQALVQARSPAGRALLSGVTSVLGVLNG